MKVRLLVAALAAVSCQPATPADPAQSPVSEPAAVGPADQPAPATELGPPTHYRGREIAQTMGYLGASWLVRPERESEERASELLASLRLRPKMVTCDIGAGNGFHTLSMAKAVAPGGRALAVDIQPEMLDMLTRRAKEQGIDNVETILGKPGDPNLPADTCDVILLVDVYHEFAQPERMLAAMRRALTDTGVIALVEFRGEDPEVPIKPLHKMTKAQIMREFPPNGLELAREHDGLPWQHVMFFRRR